MRLPILPLSLGLSACLLACGGDFESTYVLTCPSPAQVGTSVAINIAYTSVDPVSIEWRLDPMTAGTFGSPETRALPTNKDEPVIVGTTFEPTAVGQNTVFAFVDSGEVASCQMTVEAAETALTLTVAVVGMGTVTAANTNIDCPGSCTADLVAETKVELTATPATDWEVERVTGGCTTAPGGYEITLQSDATCIFTFVETASLRENEISIAAGPFTRGCANSPSCSAVVQAATVFLSQGFAIDKYEVTTAQFRRCIDNGACAPNITEDISYPCNLLSTDREQHPVNCVNWSEAQIYCQWLGKDLPTEAQWERAARGKDDARAYPWGDELPTPELAHILAPGDFSGTAPVGMHPLGASPDGIENMAANVREWTLDWFVTDYYLEPSSEVDPTGPDMGNNRVVRGGSFRGTDPLYARHNAVPPGVGTAEVGFRCVRN